MEYGTSGTSSFTQKLHWLVIFAICISIMLGAAFVYHKYINPGAPITYLPHSVASTPSGVQQAANNANVHISNAQSEEIAQAIKASIGKKPDEVVATTGDKVPAKVDELRKKNDAQFSVVTDPKNPDKPPTFKPTDQITLNAYSIKAYPKHMIGVAYSTDNSIEINNYWRVKAFGNYGYIGLGIEAETNPVVKTKAKISLLIPY